MPRNSLVNAAPAQSKGSDEREESRRGQDYEERFAQPVRRPQSRQREDQQKVDYEEPGSNE